MALKSLAANLRQEWVYFGIFLWIIAANTLTLYSYTPHIAVQIVLKLVTWFLPIVVLLQCPLGHWMDALHAGKTDLLPGIRHGLLVSIIMTSFFCCRLILQQRSIVFGWTGSELLMTIVAAAVCEEVFFRGALLQKLACRMPFFASNLWVSVFFVFAHVPAWYAESLSVSGIVSLAGYTFSFSLLLGYCFHCTHSLYTPILLHACNNLLALLALGAGL